MDLLFLENPSQIFEYNISSIISIFNRYSLKINFSDITYLTDNYKLNVSNKRKLTLIIY